MTRQGLPIGIGTGLPRLRKKVKVDDDDSLRSADDTVDERLLEFITSYRALDSENRDGDGDLMNDFLDEIGGMGNLTDKQKQYIQQEVVRDGDKFNLREEFDQDEY